MGSLSMASASSGAMNSLLAKLAMLMGEEYTKLKGVRKEVRFLEEEFSSMKALLERLADMDELDVQTKEWRNQVREMSYDIEDCIDDFMHQLNRNNDHDTHPGFVKKTARLLKKLRVRHQIASKIQEIKTHVKELSERRMRYNLDQYISKSSYVPVDPRVVAIYTEAIALIGMDAPRDELVNLLKGDDQDLKVVSIVGFGGLGKTTLANQVYRKLEGQFDICAFVSVSQKPDILRLLTKILLYLTDGQCSTHASEVEDLINKIRVYLQNKRYFIVVDDLWDQSHWDVVKCAFPQNNRRSRVLTTTRISSVAMTCCSNNEVYVYKMKPLNGQDSRRLFCNRIFGSGEDCPGTFEEDTTGILKKCGGLPLAIISISSLLAGQPKTTWEYVRNSLGSMFEGNLTLKGMEQILDLSYKSLRPHLKTCLLYLGMYPEDFIIRKNDLVRQWIAEGFAKQIHGRDAEEVGESYFNELINMSMIQPVRTDYSDEVLSCRVHDIMLDLIRFKSADENFISAIDGSNVPDDSYKKIRRASLDQCADDDCMLPTTINKQLSSVRSIMVFSNSLRPLFVEFKYLRVVLIDFTTRRTSVDFDLSDICGLSLLLYLRVANTRVKLPSKVGDLLHLETMDLKDTTFHYRIPSDIISLPRLLHLTVRPERVLPNGIDRLKSLCTLHWFDLNNNSVENIQGLGKLTNLRDLQLSCSTNFWLDHGGVRRMEALRSSLETLSHFGNLKNFVMKNYFVSLFNIDSLSTLSPSPRHLRRLHMLDCLVSRIPRWIAELHDLQSLEIMVRKVVTSENDVEILAGLPSLVHLSLRVRECPEERVVVSGTGTVFRALKHLEFTCPYPLLAFEKGGAAMPRLERLDLRFRVEGWARFGDALLPAGIEHLRPGLREVHLHPMGRIADDGDVPTARSAFRRVFQEHHPGATLFFQGKLWDFYGEKLVKEGSP